MLLHAAILLSTVALLISMGFFLLGSLPLLILKHDRSLDARFIRCVFNTHYVATLGIALIATVSRAQGGQPVAATFMAMTALYALTGRLQVVKRMDALRRARHTQGVMEVAAFRRLHIVGMAANAVLLVCYIVMLLRVGI